MAEGAALKPEAIKANTLNDHDLMIGPSFREQDLALVAHFDPLPPQQWKRPRGMSDADWRGLQPQLKARAAQRRRSFRNLERDPKFAQVTKPVTIKGGTYYKVEGGLVKQIEIGDTGEKIVRPLTGDADVFAGAKVDGSPLSASAYDDLDHALVEADFSEHGFHLEWKPRTAAERDVYYTVIERHLDDPLIEIGADLVPREVKASELPEVRKILESSEYARWKRGRTQQTVRTGIAAISWVWAHLEGNRERAKRSRD
jgi:hypothetical protein